MNLRSPAYRRFFIAFALLSGLFLVGSVVGAYRAYEFSESPRFCGALCHEPMGPQFAAYQQSPHAHVECVHCHVGPKIQSYIKAKVSGLRQVYGVLGNTFERPIHAPPDKILPANETCEHCHWADKFTMAKLSNRTRFGYDVANSKRYLRMILRNRERSQQGPRPAAHWHSNLGDSVTYRSADHLRQEVARVEVVAPDGAVTVYDRHADGERQFSDDEVAGFGVHRMDCLACHNRPAHQFKTPDLLIDRALQLGSIDSSLPFIKRIAMQALASPYPSSEAAIAGIRQEVTDFYATNFAGVLDRKESLEAAIDAIQQAHRQNIFPDMNVNWSTYPDNIGHRAYPGCFRCHGGDLVSQTGEVLPSDCDLCHVFFDQSRDSETLREIPADGLTLHPFRSAEHYETACWTCHSGATSPYSECGECHQQQADTEFMRFECSACHSPGDPLPGSGTCLPCHPTGESELHALPAHSDCLACHRTHDWGSEYRSGCLPCHDGNVGKDTWETHYPGQPCTTCHDFSGVTATVNGLSPVRQVPAIPVPEKPKNTDELKRH